jgi:cellobiose epimerase
MHKPGIIKLRRMKYLVMPVVLILTTVSDVLAQSGFDAEHHRQQREEIQDWMHVNSRAVFTFWNEKAAINKAEDGFYGDINLQGVTSRGQRNSIQQGRQLFTVSIWYRLGGHSGTAAETDQIAETAYNQFRYFIRDFHDHDGGEFYINDFHKPDNSGRRLYNNSFAIYGLAHYYLAFRNHDHELYRDAAVEALAIALETFSAMDRRAHDTDYQGYQQVPVGELAANEVRLDGGDKEINTHMHIMEALTSLYEAWLLGGDDLASILPAETYAYITTHLHERLDEMLVDVIVKRFCLERDEFAICRTEFDRDWTLVNNVYFSYAHDIETAWLLLEALRVMGDEVSDTDAVLSMAGKLIHTVYTYGFQQVGNGYALVARGNISDLSVRGDWKDWWQHFEAFTGLYQGARLSTSTEHQAAYLLRLRQVLTYLDESGIKVAFGNDMWEYRWNTSGNNTLANEWKAGYHTLRAMLFVQEWIREDIDNIPTGIADSQPGQPRDIRLGRNYPNPFNPETVITYELPVAGNVRLEIFDITGRSITLLADGVKPAGHHTATFFAGGAGLTSGIYLYRLTAGKETITRKMMLVK